MSSEPLEKDLVRDVRNAWNVWGPRPDIHLAAMKRLKEDWPTLYRAVKNLAEYQPEL